MSLQIFLGLVTSYLYDKIKGAFYRDPPRVRLRVVYKDKQAGVVKRFEFEGDAETLRGIANSRNVRDAG